MVRLIEWLREEPDCPTTRLVFMVAVSGVAGGALLPTLSRAAERIADHQPVSQTAFVILILLVLTAYSRHDFLVQTTRVAETALLKLQVRIGHRLRRAPLPDMENLGPAAVLQTLPVRDARTLIQSAQFLGLMVRSTGVASITLVYVGWLSVPALLAAMAILGVYLFIQFAYLKPELLLQQDKGRSSARALFRQSEALLGGLKELQLNRRKHDGLFEQFAWAAAADNANRHSVGITDAGSTTLGFSAFYLLLAVLVLAIPGPNVEPGNRVFEITAAALFLVAELNPWPAWISEIILADASLNEWCRLERTLADEPSSLSTPHPSGSPCRFRSLRLEGVEFRYPEDFNPLSVGPLDLSLRPGELVFITGPTGSGKTTVLKLLAGLYIPKSGVVRVDDAPVGTKGPAFQRELFAAVFQDFWLFDRLYGLQKTDPARIDAWLKRMGLAGNAASAETAGHGHGGSAGQRRRLAFVAAVLEDKPILLLDQFAQDQDPVFRDRFYREILPDLKEKGTTVVAVTHDEPYFGLADRVLTMAEGKLVQAHAGP